MEWPFGPTVAGSTPTDVIDTGFCPTAIAVHYLISKHASEYYTCLHVYAQDADGNRLNDGDPLFAEVFLGGTAQTDLEGVIHYDGYLPYRKFELVLESSGLSAGVGTLSGIFFASRGNGRSEL